MVLPVTTQMLKLSKGKLFSYLVAVNNGMQFHDARNYANHALQGSRAIPDSAINNMVKDYIIEYVSKPVSLQHLTEFVDNFKDWVGKPELSAYDADFSSGTTQAFDSFYFRHRTKRFRCFVGEYFYHLKNWESNTVHWRFISNDDPLSTGDALVISYPFCDTGNFWDIETVLKTCDSLAIPVLLDMCYYPLTQGNLVSFEHISIDTIAFSLSKTFPVANYRIGVRYTKPSINDGQKLHHSINYNNMLSAFIGRRLIEDLDSRHVYNIYKSKQEQACEYFGLAPSDSVLFATGDAEWDIYSRSNLLSAYQLNYDHKMFANRICLNTIYEHWELFEKFKNEY